MAAEVVTPMGRGLEPARKPFRAEERAKKRRNLFIQRISRAKTPGAKVDAAVDYYRAMAADSKVDPVLKTQAADQVVRYVVDHADQLAKTIRRGR